MEIARYLVAKLCYNRKFVNGLTLYGLKLCLEANDHWPESCALGNAADFWLASLPMALPQKFFA